MNKERDDIDLLPPTQYLIIETLVARHRLGEHVWTFPTKVLPAVKALELAGWVSWKYATIPNHVLVWLTSVRYQETISDTYVAPIVQKYQDVLGSIWLYIKWQYVTKQLTTEQKELFADAVDASSKRLHDGLEDWTPVATRWWND